jgi:predicted transcriptional regulator
MGRRCLLCIGLLVALLLFTGAVAYADDGGYVVRPMTQEEEAQFMSENHPSMEQVQFWQLPLLAQITFLTGSGASLLVLVKLLPLTLLKLVGRTGNGNRDAIYRYIEAHPGCTGQEIARGKGMNLGSVRYHLYRLELSHKIRHVKTGKFIRFFRNNGAYSEREVVVISAMHIRTSRAIMRLLDTDPGLSNKQISDRLKIKASLAHKYLQDLASERIIRFEKTDQHKMYYLENDVCDIIKKTGRRLPGV